MALLPKSGHIECAICHRGQPYAFDVTRTTDDGWRITNNPLAWGNSSADIVVLGFSKGPTQAGALATQLHDAIAFRNGRTNLAKILHHVGLLKLPDRQLVDQAIADQQGRFHFGSFVRCTVERFDSAEPDPNKKWKGTEGGMLDKFIAHDFGKTTVQSCASRFLGELPPQTKLIVMLGLGAAGNYVQACRQIYATVRPGPWRTLNEVSYTDDKVVVVHTEHFASQGAMLPNWLSGEEHERGRLGLLARSGVKVALSGSSMSLAAEQSVVGAAATRLAQPPAAAAPIAKGSLNPPPSSGVRLFCFRPEFARAYGHPLPDGRFLVKAGSTTMREGSPRVKRDRGVRDQLVQRGILAPHSDALLFRFAVDHVFSSPSQAAGVVKDGNASGPGHWIDQTTGKSLRDFLS